MVAVVLKIALNGLAVEYEIEPCHRTHQVQIPGPPLIPSDAESLISPISVLVSLYPNEGPGAHLMGLLGTSS